MAQLLVRSILLQAVLFSALARGDFEGHAVDVVSGDTLQVTDSNGAALRVRLLGVAAPAMGHSLGEQSRQSLARLVAGQAVRVVGDGPGGKNDLLAKVWVQPPDCPSCGQTLNVNLAQITAGMARWSRCHLDLQSEEDRGRYASAEEEARARGWGMWAEVTP